MDDPIKIISKIKNNNKRIHYHVHIFFGDILNQKLYEIF